MRKAGEVRHVCAWIQSQLVQQMFLSSLLNHFHTCSSCWCGARVVVVVVVNDISASHRKQA